MADNLEIRVDQLTSAIRGLYDKPTATVNDVNSAINSIAQRIENLNNVSREQLGQILVSDIRRIMDEKHGFVQEHLLGFENTLRQIAANSSDQKLSLEVTRIISDLSSLYTKLNAQETLLVNISKAVDSGSREELERLKNEFATFSRGFETMTQGLNKNFGDFLLQVQSYSGREDFKKVFTDLDNIQNNTNAVISALAIIDHKYKDLTGLIDLVSKKENAFTQGLDELKKSIQTVENLNSAIRNNSTKDDVSFLGEKITLVNNFLNNIKTFMESTDSENKARINEFLFTIESKLSAIQTNNDLDRLKEEMRTSYMELKENSQYIKEDILARFGEMLSSLGASADTTQQAFLLETSGLKKNIETLSEEMMKLQGYVSQNFDVKADEMRIDIKSLMSELERIKLNIEMRPQNTGVEESILRSNDENFIKMYDLIHEQLVNLDNSIDAKTSNSRNELASSISNLHTEVKSLMTGLINLKNDMGEATRQNLDVLRGPIEKALENIENLTIGSELKQLSIAVDQTVTDIKKSFETMKDNFADIATTSNIQVLQQLNSSIPSIADRLEIFRTHVVSENSANLKELRQSFNEVIETIKVNIEHVTSSLKSDFGKINEEVSQTLRIDLQKLSDHLVESVEGVNLNISQEFNDHKVNIDELLVRIQDYEDKFKEKLDSLETTFEGLNQDTCDRVAEAINTNNAQYQQVINIVKKEILTHVTGMSEYSKAGLAELSVKLDQVLETSSLNELTSVGSEDKNATLLNIENKLERSNLQQIHNAKELMEELQQVSNELSFKIDNVLEMDDSGKMSKFMARLEDKIQGLLDNGRDIDELSKITKSHIDLRTKELIQKLSKLADIQSAKGGSSGAIDEKIASNTKINELVSGLEFLQKNIFEEMKESFNKQNDILKDVKEAAKEGREQDVDAIVRQIKEEFETTLKNTDDSEIKKLGAELEHIAKNIKLDISPEEIAKNVKVDVNPEEIAKNIKLDISSEEIAKNVKVEIDPEEIAKRVKVDFDVEELLGKIKNIIPETPAPVVLEQKGAQDINVVAEIPKALEGRIESIEALVKGLNVALGKLQKSDESNNKYTYTLEDVESDLAKIRLSIEKSNAQAPKQVVESPSVNYSPALDDIRGRLQHVQKMTSSHAAEIVAQVTRKITAQDSRFDLIESKLSSIVQKQSEEFDIKAFIDVFYENTTQTKSLAARVENVETQLATISRNMQKIISYIEE